MSKTYLREEEFNIFSEQGNTEQSAEILSYLSHNGYCPGSSNMKCWGTRSSTLQTGTETVAATLYKHKHPNITRYAHLRTELAFDPAILPYGYRRESTCHRDTHTSMFNEILSWLIRRRTSLEVHRQLIYTKKKKNEIVTGRKMDATKNCYTISTVHH